VPDSGSQEPGDGDQEPGDGQEPEGSQGADSGAQEPPTLDKRLTAFAAEAFALREAVANGAACSREAMHAAMTEARDLTRDLAEALSNTARATA
jgi:hypothetical protein